MKKLVAVIFAVLALPAVAQAAPDPTPADTGTLVHMAKVIGSDCHSAIADSQRDVPSAKVPCTKGKVVEVSLNRGDAVYTQPWRKDRKTGKLSPPAKYGVAVRQKLCPVLSGCPNEPQSATGCHEPGNTYNVIFPPGGAYYSDANRFVKYGVGSWENLWVPKINYNRLINNLTFTDLDRTHSPQQRTYGFGMPAVSALAIYAEFEEVRYDIEGLRNTWCNYFIYPGNDGWYQGAGTIGPCPNCNPQPDQRSNATGVAFSNPTDTTAEASLLPSCYRGHTNVQYGYTDGLNVVDAASPAGWVDPATGYTCAAGFENYLAVEQTYYNVIPGEETKNCQPTDPCHIRAQEADMLFRGGTSGGDLIGWCLENQGDCDGLASTSDNYPVYSMRSAWNHEWMHWLGEGHAGGPGSLMGGAAKPIGNGNYITGRMGCLEAKFINEQQKPFVSYEDAYVIFAPGHSC